VEEPGVGWTCIVDTAGCLAIDAEMMEQVRRISETTSPDTPSWSSTP
jgi:signal recognition particle GTPase